MTHVFLCMLAYHVKWQMQNRLAFIPFDDHAPDDAAISHPSIVAPAQGFSAAKRKATTKVTDDGLPVHCFRTLLTDLVIITRNTVEAKQSNESVRFEKPTCPPLCNSVPWTCSGSNSYCRQAYLWLYL
jgi:hypothetical protein